jgi:calcium-dependent protein kinase
MVQAFLDKKDKEAIIQLFESIDEDRNSEIDAEDIGKAYREKYLMQLSEADLQKIKRQLDVSREGAITVTEFMLGACNKNALLTEANLKLTFNYLDAKSTGFITREEVKSFLGVDDDTYVGLIMEEADDDCDGGLN